MFFLKFTFLFLFDALSLVDRFASAPHIGLDQITSDGDRQAFIRDRFKENWAKFLEKSQGADEIDPITGEPKTTWGGWGVTLIDSLDTLYIMDLKEEFEDAVNKVSKVDFTRGNITTSFFEVVIRNLGGLISAYDLSGKPVLLKKAKALADVLIKDFDSPSGFPYTNFDFKSGEPIRDSFAPLANIGTCQLEFARLSILTGDNKYRNIAFNVYDKLDKVKPARGVYGARTDVNTGRFTDNSLTWGALGDSFFEYLLKIPVMLGKKDNAGQKFLKMFKESAVVMENKLIKKCQGNKICLGRLDSNGHFDSNTHHLEFFVPGLLLLGGKHIGDKSMTKLGLNLLETFRAIPRITATGLAPESVDFGSNSPVTVSHAYNSLRPELSESLFYAYRFTHESKYRTDTWDLFKAFDTYSRVQFGYAEYNDVNNKNKEDQVRGSMPSFFYAETFKYLYLTFCPDSVLPLDKWVFNTEAHPFHVSS